MHLYKIEAALDHSGCFIETAATGYSQFYATERVIKYVMGRDADHAQEKLKNHYADECNKSIILSADEVERVDIS